MGDMLSQAEIDALLNGGSTGSGESASDDLGIKSNDDYDPDQNLSSQEVDALGEIGNISMGTSATTLFTLLGQKVMITTPTVSVLTWEQLSNEYGSPYVAVKVEYTHGLVGSNLLILKEDDVKIITDLMMGGEGNSSGGELTDLHLSAISEAMNQMVGSSATSMSSMFDKRIDISPPKAFVMHFDQSDTYGEFDGSQKVVKIAFKMEIGNLIDSEIMQLIPINFAKSLVDNLLNVEMSSQASQQKPAAPQPPQQMQQAPQNAYSQPPQQMPPQQGYYQEQPQYGQGQYDQGPMYNEMPRNRGNVNVQPVQFQSFDEGRISLEKKNIGLIMDVPLQVTVELGRTNKMIKDILEFGPGSIIELDKLAGEPVDILVNGKVIAKGEVVVIDESFGVRITDIIHPSKRL
ncbi:MAG TPA: flagellar motor switch phosphatase FliY [Clostridia bacterium]|nr:flagellar motor switch phosphatase FliY [Clostridia bacterium]